jgi:predicted kinase
MFGKGRREGEAAAIGEGVYSEDASRQTYDKLAELAETVLQSGYSVIIDATFLERQQRNPFKQLVDRLGVPIRILFFRTDADLLRQRISSREREGSDISEADLSVLEHQLETYTGLDDDEQGYTVTIDTESINESQQILELINQSL